VANLYPYIAGLHEGKEPPQVTWHHVDPRYGAVPIQLNKKLVYAEIGGSRLFGESFLRDVERETFIYREQIIWGQPHLQQWRESCQQFLDTPACAK
jgi:hypothetical protein